MFTRELTKCPPRVEIGQMSRILVVEDEELIRDMVVLALEAEGYAIATANNGQAALALLQSAEPNSGEFPFDLLILDLMLPQINGLDICRRESCDTRLQSITLMNM